MPTGGDVDLYTAIIWTMYYVFPQQAAEKSHVDRAHTVRAGLRPGTAALDLIGGMRKVFGDSDRPYDPDADDDDIDKELRRQERAVKDGIDLVM